MKKLYFILIAFVFTASIHAQCPTFIVFAPSGTVIGCSPSSIPLNALNTSTLSSITYTWVSASTGATTGSTISATAPTGFNTFTVLASSPSSTCISSQTFAISSNTAVPSVTVLPVATQSLGCNQPCKTFTAISTSTPNYIGTWYSNSGPMTGGSTSPAVVCIGSPGTYTINFVNSQNGCSSSQTVAVTSNSTVPTLTVTSMLGGFQINCTKSCLPLNINSSASVGPITFTWTNLTTSVSTFPPTGGYTVCQTGANVPGKYSASVTDGFGCTVATTITIGIDTLKPAPTSTATLSSLMPDSYTINCFTPSVVVTAITNPMLPVSSYSWVVPPNLIQSNNTATISMVNVTATMPSSTNYTVLAMNPANGCVGRKIVRFYKDIFVPPYVSVFTPSAITCANPCVAFSPFAVSSNTTPITFTFTSPPPTTTATIPGALFCIAGTYTMTYMNTMNGCTANSYTAVPLNSPCAVNELKGDDLFTIYPNPSTGQFYIDNLIGTNTIEVFDITGKLVYSAIVGVPKYTIDLNEKSKGIYLYKIKDSNNKVQRGKLIIQH